MKANPQVSKRLYKGINLEKSNATLHFLDGAHVILVVQNQDRKLAELHFKLGLVLQFLQKPQEALNEVDAAIAICTKCLQPVRNI